VKRRNFIKLGAAIAAMPIATRNALALDYPTRPVQVIVGQAAASSSDITARLISQFLSQHLGQQFVVEVRPGATGNIATEQVVRAAPDGYTLLLVNSQNTINAALFPNLPFDFVHDIAPIAGVFRVPLVMEVLPNFPAQTVPEFIAYAKSNPGKINMASAGVGGPQHVAGELFKFMAGVDLVHVPYHGSTPAVTDLLAGQVQVMFDVTPTALPQVRAGRLRALAVTMPERLDMKRSPNLRSRRGCSISAASSCRRTPRPISANSLPPIPRSGSRSSNSPVSSRSERQGRTKRGGDDDARTQEISAPHGGRDSRGNLSLFRLRA
jgi:tripartite-type tricarboxylate transporter receptor subunit TctC